MDILSYDKFIKILNKIHMNSTYMGVLLYTLTDLDDHSKSSIDEDWIQRNDDSWIVDLKFLAIRYLWYYWKIYNFKICHMPKRQADSSDPQNDTLNIFKIIREQPDVEHIPDIKSLEKNHKLGQRVIDQAIKNEPLNKITKKYFTDFISYNKNGQIELDVELINIIKENRDRIRKSIQEKIAEHLQGLAENSNFSTVISIQDNEEMGPFSKFLSEFVYRQIFLVCVDGENNENIYEQTMNIGVEPDGEEIHGTKNVNLWAIKSTTENKNIWNEINQGDIVLFVHDGWCFLKAFVKKTVHSTNTAQHLWGGDADPPRDLLIIFESVQELKLDLTNPNIPLINPTVQNSYNFPIIKVVPKLNKYLHDMHNVYAINTDEQPTHVDLKLIRTETKSRRGQEKFRNMVLQNYHNKCAVCNIDDQKLLEAAHVRNVGHIETAGDLDNGICLCALHHKMFDVGYLYFDDEYTARLTKDAPKFIKDSWICPVINKSSCKQFPSKKYLRLRRENYLTD